MMLEIVKKGYQFYLKIPKSLPTQIITFIWNYLLAGIFFIMFISKSVYLLIAAILFILVRLELVEKRMEKRLDKPENPALSPPAPIDPATPNHVPQNSLKAIQGHDNNWKVLALFLPVRAIAYLNRHGWRDRLICLLKPFERFLLKLKNSF